VGQYAYGENEDNMISIEKTYVHPDFNSEERTMDQMLVKLARPSTEPYLKHVNFDPSIPKAGEDEITVIGLGQTSFKNGGSPDVLQQVSLSYIENEECEKAKTQVTDLKGDIYPDMICVKGKDSGACFGDSGGPHLLLGDSRDDDVQIGIVSWGIGCAHDQFPGVGSRTSASDFVRSVTCAISSDPPESFHCDGAPTASPAPTRYGVPVVISIYFDPFAFEVSWELTDEQGNIVFAQAFPETYERGTDYMQETVLLPPGENYIFTIKDSAEDGILGDGTFYDLILVDQDVGLVLVIGDGDYGASREHKFTVPTSDLYPEPVPVPPTPSPAPSVFSVPVFVQIIFDDWHEETSWKITSDQDAGTVYAEAPPGTYRYGDSMTEEIILPPGEPYRFTILDEGDDGILVNGMVYKITTEDQQTGELITLLEKDGDFSDGRTTRFNVPFASGYQQADPCAELLETCSTDAECCSNRCRNAICRTNPQSKRTSLGRLRGGSGGAFRFGGS
jgi:hypothetical protein